MYADIKKEYEKVFKRDLTDVEIAEALYEKNQSLLEELESNEEEISELRSMLQAEREKEKRAVSDEMYGLVRKIEDLKSIPCQSKTVYVTIGEDGVRIDLNVRGMYED